MDVKNFFKLVIPQSNLNKSLRVLLFADTSMFFIIGVFAPFYAVFVQKIGGDIAIAGFSWALFTIVAGVLTILFSRWELKVKEQELLLALGYVLRGLAFLSYAFMDSIGQLFLTQMLWGLGAAFGVPAFDAIYSSHTTKKVSIVQWGRREGVASIATGLAALLGGVLIQAVGYQPVFLGMFALSILLGIYIWRLPRELL